MSRSETAKIITRLLTLAACLAFAGAELAVSAQNANSSTPMQEDAATQNTNTTNANTNRGGRRRGRRRGGNMNADAAATAGTPAADTAAAPATTAAAPIATGRCDPMAQTQADLSGSYTGTVDYPEAGLSGAATLTITGNKFTMTSGSTTQEGRITAVTTCNYTGVTMMFGSEQTTAATGPQPAPLPAVSLEARRRGNGLFLKSVPGEKRQFSFGSAGATRMGGRRGGAKKSPPAAIKPPTAMAR